MLDVNPLPERRPSLRRELLVSVVFLGAAALSIAVAATLAAGAVPTSYAVPALIFLVVGDLAVVVVFGRHLTDRLVTRPLDALRRAAEELAQGNLERRAPQAETQEFTELAERFNLMTDRLLDAQSQLVRAEKLATVGRLAAGVAHEVGNPLSAIRTFVDVLKQRGADREVLEAMTREAERIERIIKELLTYARPRDEPIGPVDTSVVVRSTVAMLERQGALAKLAVTLDCADGLPPVRGRPHQLEQVVVNLVLNAVQAASPGRATVGVVRARTTLGQRDARRTSDPEYTAPPERRSGPQPWRAELARGVPGVLLFVEDSGPGVPSADRERVFDPFFTTKPPGSGTGLGLAIVQRIVDEFGGVIWVDEGREGGAAFRIYFPLAQ
jgi:signal transduction histidine kinase